LAYGYYYNLSASLIINANSYATTIIAVFWILQKPQKYGKNNVLKKKWSILL